MPDARRLCTFTLDGHCCGVAVERVQEVVPPQELTRVPLAPPAVRGLINLRGQIVTAIDLRRRLGLAETPPGRRSMNVVVSTGAEAMSLLVDDVGEVLEADESQFEPAPDPLRGPARELIRGAYKLDDRLLLLLDVDRALDLTGVPHD